MNETVRRVAGLVLLAAALCGPLLAAAAAGSDRPLQALRDLPPAPALELPDEEGTKTWRLSELRGKVVLVNFWATWCPPCRKELPSMERLWRQFKDEGLVVLGVNVGETGDEVFAFSKGLETPLTFPLLLDEESAVAQSWPVKGLPTTFLIDKQGRMAFGVIGGRE
nr:TlpA family protein disulfide reductase [Gammaproteobacteria bacterium]